MNENDESGEERSSDESSSSDSDGSSSESDDSGEELLDSDLNENMLTCSSGNDTSDDSCSSDADSETDTSPPPPMVAAPPVVLHPCHYITMEPGPRRECFGFRICGDNIDKTIRTRYMRSDRKNSSLHYFHSYAVLNRIDASSLSDENPDIHQLDGKVVANSILPSQNDDAALKKNIAKLISRVLVENLEFFKFSFEDVIEWHIEHQFYSEMAKKSDVVRA